MIFFVIIAKLGNLGINLGSYFIFFYNGMVGNLDVVLEGYFILFFIMAKMSNY